MAERGSKPTPISAAKPMQMKLFATWEVDRTPPNCIPRLCSLTLTRLVVVRPLGDDLAAISIAVKMQSSKRILRSNEMNLPSTGMLDTELDLHFALQYPHFIKRDGNKLHIMLQRRKRYKNRTILGFKTLAEGVINMSQVLQRQMDLELDLINESKEGKVGILVAKVTVNALGSQPVDQKTLTDMADRFSDEDEEFASSPDEEGEGSDSEPMLDESGRRTRKQGRKIATNARQRNLKQKFISLLKRFRQNEGLGPDQEDMGRKLSGGDMDPTEIDDLFEELEDLSESGPEMDTLSISSTPKPSLRPFFSSSRSLLQDTLSTPGAIDENLDANGFEKEPERGLDRLSDESSKGRADSDSHPEAWTDLDASDPPPSSPPPRDKEDRKSRLFLRDKPLGKPKKSVSEPKQLAAAPLVIENANEPRKHLLEQLARILAPEDMLPDHIVLVSTADSQGSLLACRLQDRQLKVLPILCSADLRPVLTSLVNKIQKFCHSSAKPPASVKIMAIGSDSFFNSLLRLYVEHLSVKPPDWQSYIKFLIVPLSSGSIARYLASVDNTYSTSFTGDGWRDLVEARSEAGEGISRISRYLYNAATTIHLPIGEALLTYKDKSSDDDSCQLFVPFLSDVRIGATDTHGIISMDLDETPTLGGSPPRVTPPSSPNVNSVNVAQVRELNLVEPLELQLDYWTVGKPSETKEVGKGKDPNKSSIKNSFKGLLIQRLPLPGEQPSSSFLVTYSTKEKKQKIMRLGKKKEKERDTDNKSQMVEGVSRLICSSKTQTLKIHIDGVEWTGVKFFQLSAQWQTHIKSFPVAIFSNDGS